jgi:isopentenyl-diphosphate Delta-isomerase
MNDEINLVDASGTRIGRIGKMAAHEKGELHEAFSIFVFNKNGELLLQRRQQAKYHSGGLWSNTCCSHPRFKESLLPAAHRRLKEEMGIDCELVLFSSLVYRAELDNGLVENEFDYILVGQSDAEPKINSEEAEDYKWLAMDVIRKDAAKNPSAYTEWLKIVIADPKFDFGNFNL